MPLPAVSTLKGGVTERGRGRWVLTTRPLWQNTCSCCGCMLREAGSSRGSWHESLSLVFWVSQRIENKCRKEREREREGEGEKDKRQDSKRKQQKTQHSTSFYAELRYCSCDKSWTTWRMRNVAAWPTNWGCKDARSAKIMIHMAQITHEIHTHTQSGTHTHIHSLRKTGQFKDRSHWGERRVG